MPFLIESAPAHGFAPGFKATRSDLWPGGWPLCHYNDDGTPRWQVDATFPGRARAKAYIIRKSRDYIVGPDERDLGLIKDKRGRLYYPSYWAARHLRVTRLSTRMAAAEMIDLIDLVGRDNLSVPQIEGIK